MTESNADFIGRLSCESAPNDGSGPLDDWERMIALLRAGDALVEALQYSGDDQAVNDAIYAYEKLEGRMAR